jgi:phage baseplate assembly protein gpV
MSIFTDLLGRVVRLERKLLGSYKGEVTNVDDPEGLGRIKIKITALFGEKFETNWALPKAVLAGNDAGEWMIPDVGDNVWVEFQFGDRNAPAWYGGFWTTKNKPPSEAEKNIRLIKSKKGHIIIFDDNTNKLTIKSIGDMDVLVEKGNVIIKGLFIKMCDANGNVLTDKVMCPVLGAPHVAAQFKVMA